MIGKTIGRFQVVERLGSGGMGEVYLARDPQLGRDVAIKRLPTEVASDPDRRRRFQHEARSAARITHQGVAGLYDVLEEGDALYLVMEYVRGTTLRERLNEPISNHEFLGIAVQCVEALTAAHRAGIVHGDIKPENIMIGLHGEVKLLDFGVARWAAAGHDATELTTEMGPAAGTVGYMSPEVLMGRRSDHRTDLFSLGVVFYEMITEHHPFRGPTATAVGDRILHEAPAPLSALNSGVQPALESALDKMLNKDPEQRYATAEDLGVDLRAIRSAETRPLLPPSPARPRRLGWQVPAALAALLAVFALAWWAGTTADRPASSSPPGEAATDSFEASDWIIAVLPAVRGTVEDPEMSALNDGLVATLTGRLTQLTRSHDLQVIPASALRERSVDSLEAARRELGVTLALNFEARRIGEIVRVNVSLVDTAALRQLDADTVDASIDELISLEEQVAVRALRMLRVELLPMERDLLATGTDKPRAHAYYLRGRGYLEERAEADSIDAAISLFEQALRVDPAYARAHAGLGRAFWAKYELTEDSAWVARATSACHEAVALAELDAAGRVCLGTVYNGTGRYAEAAAELEQATRLDPTEDRGYIELASAYLGAGEIDRAEATYEEAIAVRPHYWAGYSWLGFFYYRQGRFPDAIAAWEQAAQLAPDSYRCFSNLGAAYYNAERWIDARRAFERALELNPDYTRAISNLGTLYFFEGRYTDSARMFEQATELGGQSYLQWGNLGDAYHWASGERDSAAGAYRRGIDLANEQLRINPNDVQAQQTVARYYAMIARPELARRHLERALQLAPRELSVLHAAAQVHAVLREREDALAYLLQAIEGGYPRAEIRVDPIFIDLLEDPRLSLALNDGSE